MAIVMTAHREELASAVHELNQRLAARGGAYKFPVSPVPRWLPPLPGRSIYQEYYLAVEGDAVRGGYILKHQPFVLKNERVSLGAYQLPLSEGTIDKRYSSVGVQAMLDCLSRQPLAFSLGIGSHDEPLTKVLKAAGWSILTLPFYLRIARPYRFLRGIRYLRRTRARRIAFDGAALTGLGPLALHAYQRLKTRRHPRPRYQVVPRFESWADEVWERRQGYSMAAVRDRESLDILYPASDPRFIRLRVTEGSTTVGWATCLSTKMSANAYFGDLRVGSLVDCFAAPAGAGQVVRAATDHLISTGADLIVTNQGHAAWCRALADAGYTAGPSNFLLALSRQLTRRLEPLAQHQEALHFTRGDGDGPFNL
jgi:hypothetical protein